MAQCTFWTFLATVVEATTVYARGKWREAKEGEIKFDFWRNRERSSKQTETSNRCSKSIHRYNCLWRKCPRVNTNIFRTRFTPDKDLNLHMFSVKIGYHLEIGSFLAPSPRLPFEDTTKSVSCGSRLLFTTCSPIISGGPSREMIGQHFLQGVLAVGHHGVPAYPGQAPPPAPPGQPQHHPTPSSNAGAQPTFIYQVLPAPPHFAVH